MQVFIEAPDDELAQLITQSPFAWGTLRTAARYFPSMMAGKTFTFAPSKGRTPVVSFKVLSTSLLPSMGTGNAGSDRALRGLGG